MGKHDRAEFKWAPPEEIKPHNESEITLRYESHNDEFYKARINELKKANAALVEKVADLEEELRATNEAHENMVQLYKATVDSTRERCTAKCDEKDMKAEQLKKAIINAALREVELQERLDV